MGRNDGLPTTPGLPTISDPPQLDVLLAIEAAFYQTREVLLAILDQLEKLNEQTSAENARRNELRDASQARKARNAEAAQQEPRRPRAASAEPKPRECEACHSDFTPKNTWQRLCLPCWKREQAAKRVIDNRAERRSDETRGDASS